MASVSFDHVRKVYPDGTVAVQDLSLEIPDGELMVLCMMGYSVHRFVNESLRIEPVVGGGLTLSQWGSVVIFVAAVLMEVYLWRTMPSRWGGEAATSPSPPAPPAPAT